MKVGETIIYRNYDITRPSKDDFVTEIAHDSLKDAKDFIDDLIKQDLIIGEKEWARGVKK